MAEFFSSLVIFSSLHHLHDFLVPPDTLHLPPVLHLSLMKLPSGTRKLLLWMHLLKKALQLLQVLTP
jgi:hypothetical protein